MPGKFLLLFSVVSLLGFGFLRQPMVAEPQDAAETRWLAKKVLDSRLLDGMEDVRTWHSFTTSGGEVVDARKVIKIVDSAGTAATIHTTPEHHRQGAYAIRMTTPTRLAGIAPKSGRGWGRSGVRRYFEGGEDWSASNRVSIWIYPDLPGFYTTALDFRLYNDGVTKLPALFAQEGETSLILRNHQWNHVVWEIGNVARDKITSFEMSYGLSGNTPEEADTIHFYFDQLELERVEPEKTEGWDVWKGRIAFSHTGYQIGAQKSAVLSGTTATEFSVIDQNGKTVLTKPVSQTDGRIGKFQQMDFSEIETPGTYSVSAGGVTSQPFRIGDDIWERTIWKALNFFYTERCGAEIPGVHGVCHRDWTCVHDNKRMNINGGWHDAGDLTQGIENTGEIAYGLFSLAERLKSRNENNELYDRVIEEARWGLDWILKTRFGDGYRNGGSINSRRTNNILGDLDDITVNARNTPMTNFEAAAVEAIAARVLRESDPRLSAFALKMAAEDWQFAVNEMANVKPSKEIWRGTFDSNNVEHELASYAIVASIDLWKATNEKKYADKATALAPLIMNAQQRSKTDWDVPMTGFYYTNTTKDRILHYCHRGREQGATFALSELCAAFPDNPEYMKWYAGVTLYAEYLKKISSYTAPYKVLPASVYSDDEYINVPESRKESFRKQVLNGVPLGIGKYLRLFPVWMDYRGHFGTILPQGQALAMAGHLRNDLAATRLAQHQLEWIVGRNPFSQSTMYGEGYDFPPLYTPSSGDLVGSLPVGIQTKDEADEPYWPVQNTWTYKEIWVHPVARWVWLLKDIGGPALVEGMADGDVSFKAASGRVQIVSPDPTSHKFRAMVPEGNYAVTINDKTQQRTFLPTGNYFLDLRQATLLRFDVNVVKRKSEITISAKITGSGSHRFVLRSDNLTVKTPEQVVTLKSGETVLTWKCTVTDAETPWVAIVVPDGDMNEKKELRGELFAW